MTIKEKVSIKDFSAASYEFQPAEAADINIKNLIFLPFDKRWELFVSVTILTNFMYNIFNLTFDIPSTFQTSFHYYTCEMVFFVTTCAMVLHRSFSSLRRTRYHQKKPTLLVAICLLTIIPVYEIYYMVAAFKWSNEPAPLLETIISYSGTKCCLRIIYAIVYFYNVRSQVGINDLFYVLYTHIFMGMCTTTLGSCAWHMSYRHAEDKTQTWAKQLTYYYMNKSSSEHWMAVGYHINVAFFTGAHNGSIHGVTVFEKILIIFLMIIGFVYQNVILSGELLATFVRRQRHKFMFSSRLKKIIHLLDDWHVDRQVRKRTIDYYKVYWERRAGIRSMPSAFNLLPFSLRKEVTVDIFWDAFRHSKLFSPMDTSFKRSLSLCMKSEFLLPGDYLYEAGEQKNKLVYILSGTVQILSEEDHDSPVLGLSGGTLLGEISCLAIHKSRVNVRCETFCEVQTLSLKAVYGVLLEHRNLTNQLHSMVIDRIEYTKWATSDEVPKVDYTKESYVDLPTLMKMKKQWKTLMRMHRSKKLKESFWQKLDKSFTSNYLDTMVICDSEESGENKICLKDKCPVVMRADSSFRNFLDDVILLAVLIEITILPYDIFFRRAVRRLTNNLLLTLDLIYYLDIYLQLSTAVKVSPEVTLTDSWDIVTYKFKDVGFYVDLVAALPLNTAFHIVGISERTSLLALCGRILKLKKLYTRFHKMEKQLFLHTLTVTTLKYASMGIILGYLVACMLYTMACYLPECAKESWFVASNVYVQDEDVFKNVFFYALSLLLNYHLTDYLLATISEIVFHMAIIFVSYTVHVFMHSEMTAAACMSEKEAMEHHDDTSMFKIILKKRNVAPELKTKLLNILEFNWVFNEGAELIGENGILAESSQKIRSDIINERFINCLKCVPLFRDCPLTLLAKLAMTAEVVVLPQDTIVQNIDVMSHNVYVVLRGYCRMHSKLPGDLERNAKIILQHGDMLAVLETLHRIKMFSFITTVTAVELISISYERFMDVVQSYKSEAAFLENALRDHLATFENILMRKGCRLPEMRAPSAGLGKVDTFSFTVFMGKLEKAHLKDEYMKPFLALNRWKFIRFFLLKSTIQPAGLPYKIYEVFRCTFIIIEVLILIFSMNLLNGYGLVIRSCIGVGRIFGLLDQYLRMHCQYYNQKGILVTHPLHTLYNYLQTAFITDFVSNLPIHTLGVTKLIRSSQLETEVICMLLLRCIAMYRPYKGLSYLQGRISWSGAIISRRIKLIAAAVLVIGFLTIVFMTTACDFKEHGKIDCESSYIPFRYHSLFRNMTTSTQVFSQCIYLVTAVYCQRYVGVFHLVDRTEIVRFIFLLVFVHVIKMVIVAVYTSTGIGGNVNLSNHQARMRQFLTFAKNVVLDENITKEMVRHYEFVWRQTLGTDINQLSQKFNLYLRTQFVCFLYESTVRSTRIFYNAPNAIVQRFLTMVKEEHYEKGAEIIRCNDVQGNIFLVHRGYVTVTIANAAIAVLKVGGLFGCFQKSGITRQTINVTASSHTTVLIVNSSKLHEIMEEWDDDNADKMLRYFKVANTEFMVVQRSVIYKSQTWDKLSAQSLTYRPTCYDPVIEYFNKWINDENKYFHLYDDIINVHIATLSAIGVLAYVCIPAQPQHWGFYFVLYTLDLIFASKFVFGFHLAYTDLTTGFKILNARLIAKRYIKKDFLLDIASWLPIEIIAIFVMPNWVHLFTLNRTLRIFYLQKYYYVCTNKLTVNKYLRWRYLVYMTLYRIQLMTSIWFMVACVNPRCRSTNNVIGRPTGVSVSNSSGESTLLAYTYVINLFTRGGLRDSMPTTASELLITALIAMYADIIVAHLTGNYANITMIQNNTMDKYDYKIYKIKLYLKSRQLSPAIFKRVWEYFLQLWALQQGEWIPYLIMYAPSYLKQDVMYFLYGYHLEGHFLFSKTHKDFLRQVASLLERRVYLPGNVIVEKGDVEHTIYFLHSGEVGAYDRQGNNEIQCFILRNEMSFGEAQGMYGIPFRVCYRALTVTTVLALQKNAWEYLLKWFPASQEEILRKAQEYSLKSGYSYYYDKSM